MSQQYELSNQTLPQPGACKTDPLPPQSINRTKQTKVANKGYLFCRYFFFCDGYLVRKTGSKARRLGRRRGKQKRGKICLALFRNLWRGIVFSPFLHEFKSVETRDQFPGAYPLRSWSCYCYPFSPSQTLFVLAIFLKKNSDTAVIESTQSVSQESYSTMSLPTEQLKGFICSQLLVVRIKLTKAKLGIVLMQPINMQANSVCVFKAHMGSGKN